MATPVVSLFANLGANGGTTAGIDTTGVNGLFVSVSCEANKTVTFSDSKGNTWNSIDSGTTNRYSRIYYCKNPTVGTGHTFTATGTGSLIAIGIIGLHGTWGSGTLIASSSGRVAAALSVTTGSVTPSANNQLVFTACMLGAADTLSVRVPFNPVLGQQNFVSSQCYGIGAAMWTQHNTSPTTATWTVPTFNRELAATIGVFDYTVDVTANVRDSQSVIELVAAVDTTVRNSQSVVELVAKVDTTIRNSQTVIEMVVPAPTANVRISQAVIEMVITPINSPGISVWMGDGAGGTTWID